MERGQKIINSAGTGPVTGKNGMRSYFLRQLLSSLTRWTSISGENKIKLTEEILQFLERNLRNDPQKECLPNSNFSEANSILSSSSSSSCSPRITPPSSSSWSSSSYNKSLHQQVTLWNKILTSVSSDHFLISSPHSSSTPPSVEEYLDSSNLTQQLSHLYVQYSKYQQKTQNNFDLVKNHHSVIANYGWDITSKVSLDPYGQAAVEIGKKSWVSNSHQWILRNLVSFYRNRGLYREIFKEYCSYNRANELRLPSFDVTPLRVLDIGSCYDPLSKLLENLDLKSIDITAVDIHPMDPYVYPCDFLKLEISPQASLPHSTQQQQKLGIKSSERLQALPPGSYHAISLVLVLSYLPTSFLRIQMIKKCRELITQSCQSDDLFRRYGVLMIVDTYCALTTQDFLTNDDDVLTDHVSSTLNVESSALKLMNWLPIMESLGFKLVKYEVMRNQRMVENVKSTRKVSKKASIGLFFRSLSAEELQSRKISKRCFSSSPEHLPIGIIGAGLGGAALAYMLHQQNIPYLLFDRDENISSRPQGYAVTIQQGISVLRSIGILTNVVENKYNKTISSQFAKDPVIIPHCTISRSHVSFAHDGKLLGVFGPPLTASVSSTPYHLSYPLGWYEFSNKIVLSQESGGILVEESKNVRQNIHMPRKALRDTLLENSNIQNIRWDHKFEDAALLKNASSPTLMTLRFRNQSEYHVSGLIGCDGIYSHVRRILLERYYSKEQRMTSADQFLSFHEKNMSDQLNFLGLFVILGISPRIDRKERIRRKVQWLDGVTRVFSMPYDEENDMWQMSFPMSTEEILKFQGIGHGDSHRNFFLSEKLKELALRQCKDWHSTLTGMLERTQVSLISGHPVYDRNPVDLNNFRYLTGSSQLPVTLLGDAWHPMSPFKAQGANQALLDAASLSKEIGSWWKLSSDTPLGSYLGKYEAEAYHRSAKKVMKSRLAAQYLHSPAALTPGNVTRASVAEQAYK